MSPEALSKIVAIYHTRMAQAFPNEGLTITVDIDQHLVIAKVSVNMTVIDPRVSECGRFQYTPEEASTHYGIGASLYVCLSAVNDYLKTLQKVLDILPVD